MAGRSLEWREYKPYAQARQKLEDFEAEVSKLASVAEREEGRLPELQARVDDLTASLYIGEDVQAELTQATGILKEVKAAAEKARAALQDRSHIKELMQRKLSKLEAEAKEEVARNFREEYRPAVEKLAGLLKQTAEVNQRVYELNELAHRTFQGSTVLPFLAWFGLGIPEAKPDQPHNMDLERWLKEARAAGYDV